MIALLLYSESRGAYLGRDGRTGFWSISNPGGRRNAPLFGAGPVGEPGAPERSEMLSLDIVPDDLRSVFVRAVEIGGRLYAEPEVLERMEMSPLCRNCRGTGSARVVGHAGHRSSQCPACGGTGVRS